MSEEFVETAVPNKENEQVPVVASDVAPEDVILRGTPVNAENKPDPTLDPSTSSLPYHTATTEQIAADRAAELANAEPQPYNYQINGYTVTEIEGSNPQATSVENANKLWKVTADGGFEQYFGNKRAAEMFAETHSPQFAANAVAKQAPAVQDIPKT